MGDHKMEGRKEAAVFDITTLEDQVMRALKEVQTGCFAAIACMALSIAIGGCKTATTVTRLEDYFCQGGLMVQHHEILVGASMRDRRDKQAATAGIISYLKSEPQAPKTSIGVTALGPGRVRPRDYWALVLSDLANVPLRLWMSDGEWERDRKINEMLEVLRERQARSAPH